MNEETIFCAFLFSKMIIEIYEELIENREIFQALLSNETKVTLKEKPMEVQYLELIQVYAEEISNGKVELRAQKML